MSRIATWNVRSIRNKENEMIREMERYNIDVLGLSETKARGNGMKVVDGASYVYSGVAEGRAKRGVAIIIAERWADCLKSWRCVSERCVTVRLNVAGLWMMLIQVYAPTDDADSQAKDEFYEEVQDTMNRVPRGDRVIVMGDFNARVGKNAEVWKGVIGVHGEDVENDSGRRLLGFSAENDLQIMNTHFEHKRIHKYTWQCPGRGL